MKKSVVISSLKKPSSQIEDVELLKLVPYLERAIGQCWKMVGDMAMEISEEAVVKFVHKNMTGKKMRFRDQLTEMIRTRRVSNYLLREAENYSHQLRMEMDEVKEALSLFLSRKFSRDLEILEMRIEQSNSKIKRFLSTEEYNMLTNSFRSQLISSPADLIAEYQNIGRLEAQSVSSLEQHKYYELARLSERVTELHQRTVRDKDNLNCLID